MSKKKQRLQQPTVRVSRDAVTGVIESTVLDDVQRNLELCTAFVETRMLTLGNADVHRLAAKLQEWLRKMVPHTDAA